MMTADLPGPASRSPVQRRSRASTDRMLASAADLFLAGGYEAVTANDVARRAGVAVGTIYGRFGSKDGLVYAVQVNLLDQFEAAVRRQETSPEWLQTPAEQLVGVLIASLARLLAEHAAILQPIMKHAAVHAETAKLGKAAYDRLHGAFLHAALPIRGLIRHRDPAYAIESCFKIAYATFARALGLGTTPDAAEPESVPQLAVDLAAMCVAFLLHPPG